MSSNTVILISNVRRSASMKVNWVGEELTRLLFITGIQLQKKSLSGTSEPGGGGGGGGLWKI